MPFEPDAPGAAHLVLAGGVAYFDEARSIFEAMLISWSTQQKSRGLKSETIRHGLAVVERLRDFSGRDPWEWTPQDVEQFTVWLTSKQPPLARSTIRNYHLYLRGFCEFLTDSRYGWGRECITRFGSPPQQVCHEYNTIAHLQDYEGNAARRALTVGEIETLFAAADSHVAAAASSGRKGALAALRDAYMLRTVYAFGLRRRELVMLDMADLHRNSAFPQYGQFGSIHVRFGKGSRGGGEKRRTVLTVPEFDWVVPVLADWLDRCRPLFNIGEFAALWPTERKTRVTPQYLDRRFAIIRDSAGLPTELTLHGLRHSHVTHLSEFGYPLEVLRQQAGHKYAATTQLYAGVSDDFRDRTLLKALERVTALDRKDTP